MNLIEKESLQYYSDYMNKFVTKIEKNDNITDSVTDFYEKTRRPFFQLLHSSKPYSILTGPEALEYMIAITLPSISEANQAIPKLKTYSDHLISDYSAAENSLTKTTVAKILKYLESNYLFLTKVFKKASPTFAIINSCNHNVSGTCISGTHNEDFTFNFLIFESLIPEDTLFYQTPEERFFYLLAKALYIRVTKQTKPEVLPSLVNTLRRYYRDIDLLSDIQQIEIIYNVLAMGLTYNSGFNKSGFFKNVTDSNREAFNSIVRQLLLRC